MQKSLKNHLVISSVWLALSAEGWQCEFQKAALTNPLNKKIAKDVYLIHIHSVSVKVKRWRLAVSTTGKFNYNFDTGA